MEAVTKRLDTDGQRPVIKDLCRPLVHMAVVLAFAATSAFAQVDPEGHAETTVHKTAQTSARKNETKKRLNLGNPETSLCPPGAPRRVEPLFEHPLRDTAITRGPDGVYYMTGTSATTLPNGQLDFENNDGIWLWKSRDLKNWDAMGQVWSISKDCRLYPDPHWNNPSYWQTYRRASRHPNVKHPVRGMVTPEIHFVKDTFYITYSMNGHGCGLLRSETGKPEGPYKDMGRIILYGSEPSLFQNDDGSVYFVWGEGWIAKMKDDMSALAEKPRLLDVEPTAAVEGLNTIGAGGAFLFKAPAPGLGHGNYHLVGYDIVSRMGFTRCVDTFIATADNVYGPYKRRDLLLSHGGQSTVFPGPDGRYYATVNGADDWAVARDKPAIIPLEPHATVVGAPYWQGGAFMQPRYPLTVGGLWGDIDPMINEELVDLTVFNAPDGYYYLTGSVITAVPREEAGIRLWRSKDLKQWDPMGIVWHPDEDPFTKSGLTSFINSAKRKPKFPIFDCELHYLKDTYWLVGCQSRLLGRWWATGGMSILMLKSVSGKPEGPYVQQWTDEHQRPEFWTPNLFEDDDGSCYLVGGGVGNNIAKLKDDLSGLASEVWQIDSPSFGKIGESAHVIKIGNTYVHTGACQFGEPERGRQTADVNGIRRGYLSRTRQTIIHTADNLKGPWFKYPVRLACTGNNMPFQDKAGQWWISTHNSPIQFGVPFLYPLDIREVDGKLKISMIKE